MVQQVELTERYQLVAEANRRAYDARAAEQYTREVLVSAQSVLSEDPRPGLIATIFDPVQLPGWVRSVIEPLRLGDRALAHPTRIITRAGSVIYRLSRGGSRYKQRVESLSINSANVGNIAEYHADTGLDDELLVRKLGESGLRIISHDRYIMPAGRSQTLGLRLLGKPTGFKLLLQKA